MTLTSVRRVFVEKKQGFDVEAQGLLGDIRNNLGVESVTGLRLINRYDVEGITEEEYRQARNTIFAEPPVDHVYDDAYPGAENARMFAMEFLPGQYDQRADSAAQCIQLLTQKERPAVMTAKVVVLEGPVSDSELMKIKGYCINPVESREASLEKPVSLQLETTVPPDVSSLEGFIAMGRKELKGLRDRLGLAMSLEDLEFCRTYFADTEKRNPTMTEMRAIDTYWSDHCRHTTFLTSIDNVKIESGRFNDPVSKAYQLYQDSRAEVYGNGKKAKDMCLMDIATLAMKEMRKNGTLTDLDESEEINACSIVVKADVDGHEEDWLVMFKNETHNHPTEIEPFGGAATCLGGAIRDPLSGRSYVYQAMRVTGSGDPRTPMGETLAGKLPQRKITTVAAAGYSSYGNQIGLATGQVAELYDPDFVAKRMEVGAVIAAAPKANVIREVPVPGDVVILLGGRTGRDGCGGATGSSKEHTEDSLLSCGAEVQKGNAPTERKIQRLFRKGEVSRLIKRCNDFGAGGVSVAIGELTEGVYIELDKVPKKYDGLDGTELAISESQERMAVVVSPEDAAAFIQAAETENLEATLVAKVTEERRLVMVWRGQKIVDLSRDFLDTNGVRQHTKVQVKAPAAQGYFSPKVPFEKNELPGVWLNCLQDLNVCSQQGMAERFDSTVGAGTLLMPFGGKHQLTPQEGMAAKLPVYPGETSTATLMTFGYNPQIGKWSPFHGAVYAVVEAVAKVVALGGDYQTVRLTLQEYFEKLGTDETRWGKPFSALLGAFLVQKELGIPAIGGKDSMSGTFKDLHVPPTLVAFAVAPVSAKQVVSAELKEVGSQIILVQALRDQQELPDFGMLKDNFRKVTELIQGGYVLSAATVRHGGIGATIAKMSFGNRIAVEFSDEIVAGELFAPDYGSIILEISADVNVDKAFGLLPFRVIGKTTDKDCWEIDGVSLSMEEALRAWQDPLENIFPTSVVSASPAPQAVSHTSGKVRQGALKAAKPRVLIPVFPGTNCEYDSARVFEKAGGIAEVLVVKNLTAKQIEETALAMERAIRQSQIVMLPGGFSAGDEPDGSGKFIAAVFRNPRIKDAVTELLEKRDGLMLGICNGFQALIKLGLLPYGEIRDMETDSPTLTFNNIGRHVSRLVRTKITSNLSPWLDNVKVGDTHMVAVSHGEGRFYASEAQLKELASRGQIAVQYVDDQGMPSYLSQHNPNGSLWAVEAISSPDGRVLGKMAHSERYTEHCLKNVPGAKDQGIFAAGIQYFR